MIARLKNASASAVWLWVFALAYGLAAGMTGSGELPKRADLAASIGFPVLLAFWVLGDARLRAQRTFYDFDSFIFFAWPFVLPVYLFKTRGLRALWTLLWFAGLWAFSWCVTVAVVMLRFG